MSRMEDHDALSRELHNDEVQAKLDDMSQRLGLLGQLLTCAIAKLGGEMAVTTTEIERAVQGQQISLTSLPNNRGYYASLVTYGDADASPRDDVRPAPHPGS